MNPKGPLPDDSRGRNVMTRVIRNSRSSPGPLPSLVTGTHEVGVHQCGGVLYHEGGRIGHNVGAGVVVESTVVFTVVRR